MWLNEQKQLFVELQNDLINFEEEQSKEISKKILGAHIDPFETIEQSLNQSDSVLISNPKNWLEISETLVLS